MKDAAAADNGFLSESLPSEHFTNTKEPLEKALPTHGSMCCVCLLWIRKSLQKKCLPAGEISIELRLLIRTLFLGLCSDVLLYRDDPVKMQL